MPKLGYSGRWALAGFCSSLASSATAKPPEPGFWLTGLAPRMKYGAVTCLAQDGAVAGGYTADIKAPGFTWTRSSGRDDFGSLAGMPVVSLASGLSDTGVVVGYTDDGSFKNMRAYRWTGSGPLQDLGLLPGETRSLAWGVSGDGNVVVGHAEHGQFTNFTGQAFRWTPTSGMQGIGKLTPGSLLSKALAVSRDGKVIVGENRNEAFTADAFVWTQATGMKALPKLANPAGTATADALSADGTVIVGRSASASGMIHAVRWVNGQIEDLVSGAYANLNSVAYAVSDDGTVVGGTLNGLGFVWTPATGFLKTEDYLELHGVEVPSDYQLEEIYAVSGDGLTIGGQARDLATGVREGFVATVPAGGGCKADCDASGELDIDDFICFQTRFAISDPYADCDASGELNIEDFICFQTAYAIGC